MAFLATDWAVVMDKVWAVVKHEAKLCYGFMHRDVSMGMLPVPAFTTASLLYRNATMEDMATTIPKSFLLGYLFLYSFVVGNQVCGVQEDRINKPDRPIAAGMSSLQAARIRWAVLTALYVGYGTYLGVGTWSFMWVLIAFSHNFLNLGDFGPTKDLCVGIGCVAQLTAAWLVGGSPYDIGWSWIKVIAMYVVLPISVQDLRDVPGDLAIGRRTMPIILGDLPCRVYISLGVLASQFLLIRNCILNYRFDISTIILSSIIATLAMALILRLFAFRDVKSDRLSYRLYTLIYLVQPLCACITLR
ncbi:UbiA prenyltransferase family-domain-containing protein [Talaromyces proteolyticus]|uniref:UbiA prenyltransferase family-domain-containing protein n=1 Tax=Talaromyces proteolyticus TaxID=1131652 RepID=A0AAD4KMY3_9EURO|nr:UbiA prenyltransferase family-domain-containing protein [Talaromyces proteolyticus]KAH8691635.1 UbiA prenyltransferase family-domain-containing protein [Talaromyces proteolyticus]